MTEVIPTTEKLARAIEERRDLFRRLGFPVADAPSVDLEGL